MDGLLVQENNTMNDGGFIVNLTSASNQYCSFTPSNKEERVKLFNLTNSEAERLSDNINKVLEVVHIYCEEVECISEKTGDMEICPRIVLLTNDGKGYTCVSRGVFSAVRKLLSVFGEPSQWDEPTKIEVKQITKGEKKILTLALA